MTVYSGHHKGHIAFAFGDTANDLLSVAGGIYFINRVTINAPMLVSAGGVSVTHAATLNAPVLTDAGSVDVRPCATLNAPVLVNGGKVFVFEDATLNAPLIADKGNIFYDIAKSCYYLFANETHCVAGCRGPFTFQEALKHWDRNDTRAIAFTAAIKAHIAKQVAA